MSNRLINYLDFVNEQVTIQNKLAKKYVTPPWRAQLHIDSARKFSELADMIKETTKYIEKLEKRPDINILNDLQNLDLTYEEVQDLPEELLNELSVSSADKIEHIIKNLINENGGTLNLDRILIGLYKKTEEIHKRNSITSRLYKMSQKGWIFSVPNKKGVYSTIDPETLNIEKVSE